MTLADAKAAAESNYKERRCEAEQFLDDLLGDWNDDDGTWTRRDDDVRVICRAKDPNVDGIQVAITLRDYVDGYDAATRCATVSLRTVLSYSYNGDPGGLIDEIRRLIYFETPPTESTP
ncbi:hypothetical protein [Mycolicibacterium iranicum]|uniref:Uncharacterized protein n=1 Tax=Mycolicibacterium iranicum TaxID=912594 RepID=A0ABT4HAS1_MYCIR|nr:hypothetical protein [Mycolicibacterium iranicum]MCZ0727261.1 hypothetical protein [Mycolicibacterium iranicum]